MSDQTTIRDYLDALASSAPTPGGGSVAGLINALGCALGEMVSALSPNASDDPALCQAAAQLQALRHASIAAMARDEAAYAGYIAATRQPRSTAEEKTARRAAMQAALVTAAEAPIALSRTALATLGCLQPVAARGNKHVLSDARIGAILADLAVRAALINVRVNTALIKDAETAARLNDEATEIENEARKRLEEVEEALRSRSANSAVARE